MTALNDMTAPAAATTPPECVVNSTDDTYTAIQGYRYRTGISAETVGSKSLCMHVVDIPPNAREVPHFHRDHETAIYVVSGSVEVWSGEKLDNRFVIRAGDFLYIPPSVPHVPINRSMTETCTVVLSRTDPSEQESVVVVDTPDDLAAIAPVRE